MVHGTLLGEVEPQILTPISGAVAATKSRGVAGYVAPFMRQVMELRSSGGRIPPDEGCHDAVSALHGPIVDAGAPLHPGATSFSDVHARFKAQAIDPGRLQAEGRRAKG